jgi:hypothetical protein
MLGDQGSRRDATNGPLINREPIAPCAVTFWGAGIAAHTGQYGTRRPLRLNRFRPTQSQSQSRICARHVRRKCPCKRPARHVAKFSGAQYPLDVQGPVTCLAWPDLIRRGRRRRSLLQLGHFTYRRGARAWLGYRITEDIVARHQR